MLLDPPHCNLTGAGLTGWLHSSNVFVVIVRRDDSEHPCTANANQKKEAGQ
ncbi:hypothetical protein [Sphingomonas endolithica]|uniref:hypothetical protein n=1 Tax=Sphingomonas endolithica TaxID=2972485 RepID=UPI0021AF3D14|nr:hypothetical protein [Sphingomonas sp. ZFBP2030]